MIYFDNAATSWPKPGEVESAMTGFLRECGANPGRSGHARSIQAGRVVYQARERVARLFNLDDPMAVAFTKNATEALNLAIFGTVQPGDHVVTSGMEHNSVMRPLREIESRGVRVSRVNCSADGTLDPQDLARALAPRTRLVILSHASNVAGTIGPIAEVGRILAGRDLLFCVDAAQTAGVLPIDLEAMGIDLLAFTGHKSLYGPQGTGGLCVGARARKKLRPIMFGGTGSASDSDRHPEFLPDCFEAGTLNAVGLAGLDAGLAFIERTGLGKIREREADLTVRLLDGLEQIPGIKIFGPRDPARRTAVVSFNLAGWTCSAAAAELEDRAGVCCRAGLHCSPWAHRQIGTFPDGTVRFSLGAFNQAGEVDTALEALRRMAKEKTGGKP